MYKTVISIDFDIVRFMKIEARVKDSRVSYHPGSAFFGYGTQTFPDVHEAVEFAFIHVAQPHSKLAKLRSILSKDQIQTHLAFVTARTTRELLVMGVKSKDEIADHLKGHILINNDVRASLATIIRNYETGEIKRRLQVDQKQ